MLFHLANLPVLTWIWASINWPDQPLGIIFPALTTVKDAELIAKNILASTSETAKIKAHRIKPHADTATSANLANLTASCGSLDYLNFNKYRENS